jgi:hypothetical protein
MIGEPAEFKLRFDEDAILPITLRMNVVPASEWFFRAWWAVWGAVFALLVVAAFGALIGLVIWEIAR